MAKTKATKEKMAKITETKENKANSKIQPNEMSQEKHQMHAQNPRRVRETAKQIGDRRTGISHGITAGTQTHGKTGISRGAAAAGTKRHGKKTDPVRTIGGRRRSEEQRVANGFQICLEMRPPGIRRGRILSSSG